MKKQSGFTLIELMIVVAIIAIIAAIAIPNLLSARLNANETSAISTLRNISSAQSQFQASSKADVDNDGTGEFGMFREMSGAANVRTATDGTGAGGSVLNPPVMSGAFRTIAANGYVSRSGYLFRIWLSGDTGNAIGENTLTGLQGAASTIVTDLAETTWCCYARPANYGNSGNRSFFVNQSGDITAKDDPNHNTTTSAGAAFINGGNIHGITGQVAVGTVGRDGLMWRQVN